MKILFFTFLILGLTSFTVKGEILSYSGRLVNASGAPITGSPNLKFDVVYSGSTGTIVCTRTQSVPLSNGVFHANLNFSTAECGGQTFTEVMSAIPTGQTLAYQVTDLTNSKAYGFQPVSSVPSSVIAGTVASHGATDGQVLKWNATTKKWVPANAAAGTGTLVDLSAGAGITVAAVDADTYSVAITNGGVGTTQLADSSVTSSKIVDGTITGTDIAPNTIPYANLNLADGSIPSSKVNGLDAGLSGKEPTVNAGTTAQYYRGDKSWQDFNSAVRAALSGTSPITFNGGTGAIGLGVVPIGNGGTGRSTTNANSVVTTGVGGTYEFLNCSVGQIIVFSAGGPVCSNLNTADNTKLPLAGGTMTGNIDMNAQKITNLTNPSAPQEAATKDYVDSTIAGTGVWSLGAGNVYRTSGNVGIGTSSPTATLTLKANATQADGDAILEFRRNPNDARFGYVYGSGGNGMIRMQHESGSNYAEMGSRFGSAKIVLAGGNGKFLSYEDTGILWSLGVAGSSSDFGMYYNGAPRFVMKSNGQLGLNTSTPNGRLDVKGTIVMSGSTSGYAGFQVPAAAGSTIWTLPAADGTSGQVLSTNGAGVLAWTTPSGGGGITALTGDVTASGAGSVAATIANGAVTYAKMNLADGDIPVAKINGYEAAARAAISATSPITYNSTSGVLDIGTVPISKGGTGVSTTTANSVVTTGVGGNYQFINCGVGEIIVFQAGGPVCQTLSSTDNTKLPLAGGTMTGNIDMNAGKIVNLTNPTAPQEAATKDYVDTAITATGVWTASGGNVYRSSGNVGIGTTTPSKKFEVVGEARFQNGYDTDGTRFDSGSAGYGLVRIKSPNGGAGQIEFASGQAGWTWDTKIFRPSAGVLRIEKDGTTSASLDVTGSTFLASRDGNVGVGTTTPNGKLDVKGNFVISGSTSGFAGFRAAAAAGSTVWTLPIADGASGQVLSTNGSGILSWINPAVGGGGDFMANGTVPMTGDLKLQRYIYGGNPGNAIDTGTSAGHQFAIRSSDADIHLRAINNNNILFTTSSNERMRINISGNVGIGTSSPNGKLDVKGSVVMSGATSGFTGFLAPATNTGNTIWTLPNADGTNGQVLTTNGSGVLSWATASGGSSPWTDSGGNVYRTSGNVGIGTSTPGQNLDVVGNAQFSGVLLLSAGTAALPSIASSTSPNQGFWFPSASSIGVSVSGFNRFTFDSGGGFAANSATGARLTSSGATATAPVILPNRTSTKAGIGANSAGEVSIIADNSGTATEMIRVSGNKTIFPSGTVGIGSSSPNGKLDVNGSIVMSGSVSGFSGFQAAATAGSTVWTLPMSDGSGGQVLSTNGAGVLSWVTSSGADNLGNHIATQAFQLGTNVINNNGGSNGLSFDTAGRATITTTSGGTSAGLTLTNTSPASGSGSELSFRSQSVQTASITTNLQGAPADSDLIFSTRGSNSLVERLRVTSTGSVGIGTNLPASTLHILTSNPAGLTVERQSANTSSIKFMNTTDHWLAGLSVSGKFGIGKNSNLDTGPAFTIDSSGNVGMGTSTPSYRLSVYNSAAATSNVESGGAGSTAYQRFAGLTAGSSSQAYLTGLNITNGNGAYEIYDQTAGASRFWVSTGGNIGVGTIAPSEKFEVAGNVKGTSFINSSDRRLKKNIKVVSGLPAILQLRGVTYDWKEDGSMDMGVIAQETEEIFPWAVVTDKVSGYKGVKYNALIGPLIEAVKDLDKKDKQIDRRIASLEEENQKLKEKNMKLEKMMEALSERLDKLESRK